MQMSSSITTPDLDRPSAISDLLEGKRLDSDRSLTSQVFALLKDLIITIKLYPGQLFSEKEVAETLNASETLVR